MTESSLTAGDYLPEHVKTQWGLTYTQFSQPSWNILLRAMARARLIDGNAAIREIEIGKLFELPVDDIKFLKHVGPNRFNDLIEEIRNVQYGLASPLIRNETDIDSVDSSSSNALTSSSKLTLEQFLLLSIVKSDDWREALLNEYGLQFEDIEFENPTTSRKIAMFDFRLRGMTLDAIGKNFNVTRERVRQVIKQAYYQIAGDPYFQGKSMETFFNERFTSAEGEKQRKELELQIEIDRKIRELLEQLPGLTWNELSEKMNFDVQTLKKACQAQTSKFIWNEVSPTAKTSKYTNEQILEALKLAEAFESPISAPTYWRLVERGLIDGPGPQTVAIRFGSWKKACESAEINYVESIREQYDYQWTESEMLLHLISFLKNPDFGRGIESYDQWRIETMNNAPSGALLRNNFGSWLETKNRALEFMRSQRISPELITHDTP